MAADIAQEAAGQPPIGDWCGADPFAPDFRDDPYPCLHALRERDPVNLTPVNTWRISRYDDVQLIFKKAKTSQTLADGTAPNFDPLDTRGSFLEFMLNMDGPEHVRLRRLALQSLGHNTARLMEAEVQESVTQAMDLALEQGGMEIVENLARYVPSRMMCKIMGVPLQDRDLFNEWTAARTNAFFARFLPPDVQKRTRDAGCAMADYFEALVKVRRKNLGDDLMSALIRAEEQGDKLRDGELVIQAIGIIIAGYETTIGLISNGLRSFLDHPDQLELLRQKPDLIANAVEECLRFDTPILFNWRILKEPYEVSGKTLPADAVIWQMLGSANRDPARFPDPDRFDIQRADVDHVAFGGGVHFCLGNQLARMEARHALGQFAQRTAGLKIRQGKLQWSHSFFRVMAELPITFH
jgi:cytochrome P450